MKKSLLLLVLFGIGGGYYFYHQNQKALKSAQTARQQEEAQAARIKAEAEAKTRAAAEAKRQEELQAAAKAKAKADAKVKVAAEAATKTPEVRLAALQQDYLKTDQVWNPYKVQLQRLRVAASQSVSQQEFDPAVKARAAALLQEINSLTEHALTTSRSMATAKNAQHRASTALMSGGGSLSERYSGWYYVDSPRSIYPISEIKKRNTKRRISYVSKKESKRDEAVNGASRQLAAYKQEHEKYLQQKEAKEKELAALRTGLEQRISVEQARIRQDAAPILAKRKQLRDEIAALQGQVGKGTLVASSKTAADTAGE